jgi:uncharacterized protein (TIGR03083 family)
MEMPPIFVGPLFRQVEQHLFKLLRSLSNDDWRRPTVCSRWSVQDIASHLLDGAIRRIAAQRDRYLNPDLPAELRSSADLLGYLTEFNDSWTRATRRISPPVLIDLLEVVSRQYVELCETADPFGPALFPVSWAGEVESLMWFDIARELTERWHHQRQIALAVGRETAIDRRELYYPVLDTFMRALPHTLDGSLAPVGSAVCAEVEGEAGGKWWVVRKADGWQQVGGAGEKQTVAARAILPPDVAWRVFTKRVTSDAARQQFPSIRLEGDTALASRVLEMVSIMA